MNTKQYLLYSKYRCLKIIWPQGSWGPDQTLTYITLTTGKRFSGNREGTTQKSMVGYGTCRRASKTIYEQNTKMIHDVSIRFFVDKTQKRYFRGHFNDGFLEHHDMCFGHGVPCFSLKFHSDANLLFNVAVFKRISDRQKSFGVIWVHFDNSSKDWNKGKNWQKARNLIYIVGSLYYKIYKKWFTLS